MIWRTFNQPLSIGLDMEAGVRMVQLASGPNKELVALAAAYDSGLDLSFTSPLSPKEKASGLTRMLRQGRFVGRDVVVSVPRSSVQHKSIRMPPMEADELAGAVEFEAKNLFDATPQTHVIDFVPMGQVRQAGEAKQEVLVAAARRDDLDQLIESLHTAGVITKAIDFEPCLLYRTIERFVRRKDDEQEVHVMLDVGLDATAVLIGRGRELCFYRPIELGMRGIWQAVARKLAVDFADAQTLSVRLGAAADAPIDAMDDVKQAVFDASRPIVDELAKEVSLCLRYATVTFRGLRPTRIRLTGLGADDFVVREVLRRSMPIALEPSKPIMNADLSKLSSSDRSGNLSAWTRAYGLALRDAPAGLADKLGLSRSARTSTASSPSVDVGIPAEVVPEPVKESTPAETPKSMNSSEVLSA
jgi:type IV pilus assembly protein PilM